MPNGYGGHIPPFAAQEPPAQQVSPRVQGPFETQASAAGAIIKRMTGAAKLTRLSIRRRERFTLGTSEPFSSRPASANCLSAATTTSGHKSAVAEMTSTGRSPSHSAQIRLADALSEDAWCVASTYRSNSPSTSCDTRPLRRGRGMKARAVDMGMQPSTPRTPLGQV
jgi:hypothetical protein